MRTYGLAYWQDDPDGYRLYAFTRGEEDTINVNKIDIETGEMMLAAVVVPEGGGRPGGIFITNLWDVYSWVMVSLVQNSDRLAIWHLVGRTDWLGVEPAEGVIEGYDNQELTVILNSLGFPEETELAADLRFTHDGRGGVDEIPIQLSITGEGGLAQRGLDFNTGWNMVSLNLQPANDQLPDMFAALVEEEILLFVKDGSGNFYAPAHDFINIERWIGVEGYQVKVARDAELTIEGEVISWDTPIALEEGWNMISYLPRNPIDAAVALSNIGDDLEIAKDGWGNFYIPAWDFSNIGDMREGLGYHVRVDSDVELVYNIDGQAAGLVSQVFTASEMRWIGEIPCSGSSYSLLLLTEGFQSGTKFEAYTPSGTVAGRGIVGSDGKCGMALWGEVPDHRWDRHSCLSSYNGFLENDELAIYSVSLDGARQAGACALEWIDGTSTGWTADGWGVAKLISEPLPAEFGILRAYPNPFNERIRIEFALAEKGEITLGIYDLNGRLVKILTKDYDQAGIHSISWHAKDLPSGIYLLELSSSGDRQVLKIALLR